MNNCFSIYYTSYISSGPKSNFICDYVPSKAILFFSRYSAVNSTWLITSELESQRGPKVLFTCVVYTKYIYYSFEIFPRFWLVKTTPIIHHNQLLLTRFETNLLWYWTNDVKSAVGCRLLNCSPRKPCDEIVLFLVSSSLNFSLLIRSLSHLGRETSENTGR